MTKYYHQPLWAILLFTLSLLACVSVSAETDHLAKNKGVSIKFQKQDQMFKLNELSFDHPALQPLAQVKDQIVIDSEVELKGLQLDYRVKPYLNLFGSIDQSRGTAILRLSQLPSRTPLSDVKINTDGTMYSVGATLLARDQDYFAALTYVYSLTDMTAFDQVNSSYAVMPVIGKKTPIGAISTGLRYQHTERDYSGTLAMPTLGNARTNMTLSAENTDKLSYIAGLNTELGRDVYLRTYLEFGDREGLRLEIGHRF